MSPHGNEQRQRTTMKADGGAPSIVSVDGRRVACVLMTMDFGGWRRGGVTMGTRSIGERVGRGVARETLVGLLLAGVWASACGGGSGSTSPHAEGGSQVTPTGDGSLSINEIMSLNVLTTKDENGAASPWIEIYNPTGQDIDLTGYALTDDFNFATKGGLAEGGGRQGAWDGLAVGRSESRGGTHAHQSVPAGRRRFAGAGPPRRFVHQPGDLRRAVRRSLCRARAGWIEQLGHRMERLTGRGRTRREWGNHLRRKRPAIRPR